MSVFRVSLCLFRPAIALLLTGVAAPIAFAEDSAALGGNRISQAQVSDTHTSLETLRSAGLRIFATPFNRLDGYGDGPVNPADTVSPGGRPTLGGNGTFLRINGLDGQSCNECHSIVRAGEVPPRLGIGGVGGSVTNAMIKPTFIDPAALLSLDDHAAINGRVANPPFIFGAGGVELLALEMTADLQALADQARATPGVEVALRSKGIGFGTIQSDAAGNLDTSQVEGVDSDLVVRPFGRKGEFSTTRRFDIEAMMFHFGMQPVEVVGEDIDGDGDGVINEIMIGELSALHVFVSTAERPQQERRSPEAERGFEKFESLGCTSCHVPELETQTRYLPLRFPEIETDASANVYRQIDLHSAPPQFERNLTGGIRVPLFADLKRHDMGEELAETAEFASDAANREFTTARLWGVADTAPYLHDGRATTLTDAILAHGGEAQAARDAFAELGVDGRSEVLAFLRTLRTPRDGVRVSAPSRGRDKAH